MSYVNQYRSEAAQAHAAGIQYFLGETNSGKSEVTIYEYVFANLVWTQRRVAGEVSAR